MSSSIQRDDFAQGAPRRGFENTIEVGHHRRAQQIDTHRRRELPHGQLAHGLRACILKHVGFGIVLPCNRLCRIRNRRVLVDRGGGRPERGSVRIDVVDREFGRHAWN